MKRSDRSGSLRAARNRRRSVASGHRQAREVIPVEEIPGDLHEAAAIGNQDPLAVIPLNPVARDGDGGCVVIGAMGGKTGATIGGEPAVVDKAIPADVP
jgi:hypothetical protein